MHAFVLFVLLKFYFLVNKYKVMKLIHYVIH